MTAPQEIAFYRGKKRDDYETKQMNARVKYEYLHYIVPEEERKEIDPCAHCGARCYLEGDGAPGSSQAAPAPATQAAQSSSKKMRTGLDMLDREDAELRYLRHLFIRLCVRGMCT